MGITLELNSSTGSHYTLKGIRDGSHSTLKGIRDGRHSLGMDIAKGFDSSPPIGVNIT